MLVFQKLNAQVAISPVSDTTPKPRVLVVPFNPDYYFSDADLMLAKHNNKNQPEIKDLFRYGLDVNLRARIISSNMEAQGFMSNRQLDEEKDIYHIYRGIGYKMDRPNTAYFKDDIKKESRISSFLKRINKKEPNSSLGIDPISKGQVVAGTGEQKYLNVVIHDPEMLVYLANKYNVDLFLFINQFEVVSHYEHCLDRATGNYSREIKIHFSIFDSAADQIYGNYVSIFNDSKLIDIDEIIQKNFPLIADYMANRIVVPKDDVTSYYE